MKRILFFLSSLVFTACQEESPSSGTRTHWLEACDTSADCSSESDCICNVCTRLCDADSDCDGGTCAPLISAVGYCGSETIEGRICLPEDTASECSTDAEPNWGFGGHFANGCETDAVLLCEDFEGGVPDEYQLGFSGTEVKPEACLAHDGSGSVAYSGLEDEGYGHVQMALSETVNDGPLHVRFWVYVPSGQDLDASVRLFAVRTEAEYTPEQVGINLSDEQGIRFDALGVSLESEPGVVGLDQWQCVEVAMDVGPAGSAEVSVEGQLVLEVPEAPTRPASGPVGVMSIFGTVYSPEPQFEAAIDDLVVSLEPIGCN